MKSKYYQALFLVGVLPIVVLAGVYFYMALNQPAPHVNVKSPVDSSAVHTTIPLLQSQIKTIAGSIGKAVQKTHADIDGLAGNHTDADLENFVNTHPGVTGIVVMTMAGKLVKTIPAAPPLIDASYGASEEFQKTAAKFRDNPGKSSLFFTQKFAYPALVFAVPISGDLVAEAVLSLSNFFRDIDPKSGEIFLLEAGEGSYFYHSNPAKLGTTFNPDQEPWLAKIQADLVAKTDGAVFNPDKVSAVWAHAGFGNCGIVHLIPSAALQPASSSAKSAAPQASLDNFPALLQTPMSLAVLLALAWVCIIGALFYGLIMKPVKNAGEVVLAAAQGSGQLTAETARRFGNDEVGKMVQAVSGLLEKAAKEKQHSHQEQEETLRKGKIHLDEKTKEASNQVAEAQKQAQTVRGELNEKNQILNDKLKEMDALKGMSEGLRTQNEQAKSENGKLRGLVNAAEEASQDLKKRVVETQGRLIEMESKLLQTVAAASAIQVSAVRAAAIRTMADELKTTLGIIKGYVSSALGTTQGGISEKQQEFLGMVINRSARLEKFINDLLDIYQVETEFSEAKTEEVNLAPEIEALAFNFQAQAEVKNIKMKVDAKGAIPKVPIVRRRFNQLWNILYLQLIKDAPRGSSVTITVEALGDNVKVSVTDPGLVVVPEGIPKLFDEFYDPKHPSSPQLAGTGLKFALVKTILAAHGGGAVAEKADPGTKMTLTFSTKIKKPGGPPVLNIPSVGAVKPAVPSAGAAGSPVGTIKPPALGAVPLGTPKPAGTSGALDAFLAGKSPSVTAPGVKPPMPAAPGAAPAPAPMGAPKPPAPAQPAGGGMLDALLDKISPPGAPVAPVSAPKPPMPAPGGSPLSGGLDALLDKKPAPPPPPPVPGVPPPALMPPSLGSIPPSPALTPPPLGVPRPPMPGMPPAPGAPPAPFPSAPPMPAAPKVVPTNIKPAAPPSGILDLDNTDTFKVDASPTPPKPLAPPMSAPKPMAPPMAPPMGGPKPPMPGSPLPPPGVPPGGLNANKPIVKDLSKEGEGDLIE